MDPQYAAIHTFTTKPWSIDQCIEGYSRHGFGGISIWRETIAGCDLMAVKRRMRDAGLKPVSLVRGGFFTATTAEKREAAIAENRLALQQAVQLELPMMVMVCGATPGQIPPTNMEQIEAGLCAILDDAEKLGVRLALEPLHPMYAGDRSALVSLRDAMSLVEKMNHSHVGIALDVYHVWWELDLQQQIQRCAERDRLWAFHVCDFKPDMQHVLLDRGLPGEGVASVGVIDSWVRDAGFAGMTEVEIFSNRYWAMDQDDFMRMIVESLKSLRNPN